MRGRKEFWHCYSLFRKLRSKRNFPRFSNSWSISNSPACWSPRCAYLAGARRSYVAPAATTPWRRSSGVWCDYSTSCSWSRQCTASHSVLTPGTKIPLVSSAFAETVQNKKKRKRKKEQSPHDFSIERAHTTYGWVKRKAKACASSKGKFLGSI